jgi:hypothetical protein
MEASGRAAPRLTTGDLEVLGIFMYGPRWQCALARAVHRNDRLVRRWVAEERPVSIAASRLIENLTRDKHGEQMRRLRAHYLDMIDATTVGLATLVARQPLVSTDRAQKSLLAHVVDKGEGPMKSEPWVPI